MALKATVGATDSNSYVTRAEADDYFLTRYNAGAWRDAEPSVKDMALVSASLALDDCIKWVGVKTDPAQSMDWPRVVDEELELADNVIPIKIKRATYEAALYLLQSGTLEVTQEIDSVKIGPLEVNINENRPEVLLPNRVIASLTDLGSAKGAGASSIRMATLVRT